ncbi:MAG TPA: TlpA disulfide reductase family protein [Candidatus Glassbacteria bacterium]|nr:TlpA disulfide reductase family protein [Candidatus Glassbacteria bacterium]
MKKLLIFISCLFLLTSAQAQDLKPWKGGPTPPLALNDINGKPLKLEDYRGKVVMVQFWATWCPPCRKEMPSMMRLQTKLAGKPFIILAVNMGETEKEIKDFLALVNADFTVPMDSDGKAISAWKVFVAPSTFLIDPKGNIRYALQGGAEWDAPEYVAKIAELLPSK